MRSATVTQAIALSAFLETAVAWPAMNKTLEDLLSRGRPHTGADDADSELIGDLAVLPDSELTPVGRSIKNILQGTESGQSAEVWLGPIPPKGSAECTADTCCIWAYIAQDMSSQFLGAAGRCNGLARASIRLGFHDAGAWSKTRGGGGADGSIVLSAEELARPENRGLQGVAAWIRELYAQYQQFGVSVADLIQMASTVATVTCPLGPRVRSFVGRVDSAIPPPPGLLPDVHSDAETLIALFEDKTISPHGLTGLIGAHTTSQQFFVDPARAGDPQDSTPGVWDTLYYRQTLGPAPPRVFRFESDINLARDPRIAGEFQGFGFNQRAWDEVYARWYVRLSLLGVDNINTLSECSKVLPQARKAFSAPDQDLFDKWLDSTEVDEAVADAVLDGDSLAGLTAVIDALKKGGKKLARCFAA